MSDGLVVVITGAASGIGAATARAFAARGARLVLADVDERGLAGVGGGLAELGANRVLTIPADVTSVESVGAMVTRVADSFGAIDVLHANAGICPPEEPLADISPATVDRILDVNVKGMVNTLRAAVPVIHDGGAIVITASVSGLIAHPGAAVYAASKIALIGLGRSLAAELAPRRIRVNMVCPGGVDTPLTRGAYGTDAEDVIAEYGASNPLGRIAAPQDIARAVVYLAEASHVTGVSLRVDGGDGLTGAL